MASALLISHFCLINFAVFLSLLVSHIHELKHLNTPFALGVWMEKKNWLSLGVYASSPSVSLRIIRRRRSELKFFRPNLRLLSVPSLPLYTLHVSKQISIERIVILRADKWVWEEIGGVLYRNGLPGAEWSLQARRSHLTLSDILSARTYYSRFFSSPKWKPVR